MHKLAAFFLLALAPLIAAAAPVTFEVTPTFAAPAGIVDGYRAYRDCDLGAQTSVTLIGPAQSGVPFSFQGDSAAVHVVCVRAFNSGSQCAAPVNGTCEGGFATVGNIAATVNPPGSTSTTYVCELNPTSGGSCVAQ